MPGMSGPDLERELRLRRREIPIVFITACADETVRPRLLAQGAVECLFKPLVIRLCLGRSMPHFERADRSRGRVTYFVRRGKPVTKDWLLR